MSGDPEQEHFCDGLVEDIITTLSKLAGLRVIARNSSFVYKGRPVDVREAAFSYRNAGPAY
jgi:adenylate cyclase